MSHFHRWLALLASNEVAVQSFANLSKKFIKIIDYFEQTIELHLSIHINMYVYTKF